MNCFMGYNPLVSKQVKITVWVNEQDGASPVAPINPSEGDCFIVYATDEAMLSNTPTSKKTYTNGDWADAEGGGGGGGDYPTVTVNVDAEKLYCELGFQPEYDPLSETNIAVTALYDTGTFYTYTFSLPSVDLNDGVTLEFLLIGDSFTLIPWADFSLPNAVSITGSATFDNETHSITVTGDCSIHLIGFDE